MIRGGIRGGTGMKNQVLFGYQVFKKIQVRVETGSGLITFAYLHTSVAQVVRILLIPVGYSFSADG